MYRYTNRVTIGTGTYGSVFKANSVHNNDEVVAIKKMKKKFYSWDECVALREVQSLKKLNHPNIVKLKEVIRETNELFFVFEFVSQNLYQLTKNQKKLLPEEKIKKYMFQIMHGLAFMHKMGYFHRDMKPENLLIGTDDIVKIADFGLAREVRSLPPYTDYVSTRWYRAPEVILRDTRYNSKIDIFAMGCIMAELYTRNPLFPWSSEFDQLNKLCGVLGSPTDKKTSKDDPRFWPGGIELAKKNNINLSRSQPKTPLSEIIPNASKEGLRLLEKLLHWDPNKRYSAAEALQDPYFAGMNIQELNTPSGTSSKPPQERKVNESSSGNTKQHIQVPANSFGVSGKYSSTQKGNSGSFGSFKGSSFRSNAKQPYQQSSYQGSKNLGSFGSMGLQGKSVGKDNKKSARTRGGAFQKSAASQLGIGGDSSASGSIAGLGFSRYSRNMQ